MNPRIAEIEVKTHVGEQSQYFRVSRGL